MNLKMADTLRSKRAEPTDFTVEWSLLTGKKTMCVWFAIHPEENKCYSGCF